MTNGDGSNRSAAQGAPGRLSAAGLTALIALVTAVQALATFAVLALPTLAPLAAPAFGLGPEVVGYQISVVYIAAASLSMIAGLLVRAWGAAMTSIGALVLASAGLVAMASGHIALAVLASVAIGCGYALTNPAAAHLLFRHTPPRRQNLVFALKQTGVPFGAMLAALSLPVLADRFGWKTAILIGAGLLLLALIPLAMIRSHVDTDRDPTARASGDVMASLRLVITLPRLRALAIMGFAYSSYQLCLFAFLITMLTQDFGWSLIAAGQMATGMQIGGVAGRIVWSLLADRIGRGIDLLIALGIGSAVCAWLLAASSSAWPVWQLAILLFVFGFCLAGWNGLWMAEVARSCRPQEVGLATGGVLVFTFTGVVCGPAVFATVYRVLGNYALTYGLFSVMALIGAAALIKARAPG